MPAACPPAVASHWYSFSFAPNPGFSRRFAPQPEIRAYLNSVAEKEGVLPRLQTHSAVTAATWDAATAKWTVTVRDTRSGAERRVTARFVVAGPGALSTPTLPDIKGTADFKGPAFHTARWDHSVSLAGKTVGIIGTGCSAAQIVPAIAPTVKDVYVFQRSAAWLSPRMDYEYSAFTKWAFAWIPGLLWLYRMTLATLHDIRYHAFVRPKWAWMKNLSYWLMNRHRAKAIPDPALRAALTPDYPVRGSVAPGAALRGSRASRRRRGLALTPALCPAPCPAPRSWAASA